MDPPGRGFLPLERVLSSSGDDNVSVELIAHRGEIPSIRASTASCIESLKTFRSLHTSMTRRSFC